MPDCNQPNTQLFDNLSTCHRATINQHSTQINNCQQSNNQPEWNTTCVHWKH